MYPWMKQRGTSTSPWVKYRITLTVARHLRAEAESALKRLCGERNVTETSDALGVHFVGTYCGDPQNFQFLKSYWGRLGMWKDQPIPWYLTR